MKFRIPLFVQIALAYSLVFSSCSHKKPLVGFMLPHMNIQRYKTEKEEFTQKMKAFGADVIFRQGDNDDQKQLKQVDSLLEAGIDLLVLDPVNRFTAAELVRKAHRKGVKVISYDRLISNIDVDGFLSFDPWMTGKQMTEVVTRLKPDGNYIILGGDRTDLNAIGIDEGQQQVLEPFVKSGNIKSNYRVFIDKWASEDAYFEVKQYLDLSGTVPDVILASSDMLARGAIDALKTYKLEGKVLVTGQGGELYACKNMIDGYQIITIYKPVKKLADLAAELAIKMISGENSKGILNTKINNGFSDIPTRLLVTIPVNADNIRSTLVADGMIKEEDLGK